MRNVVSVDTVHSVRPAHTRDRSSDTLQLGLKFPKPGAEAAHQHVIDLGRHPEVSLMAVDGNTFPLVIRLETVTERGAKEGHTLQVNSSLLSTSGW